MEVFLVRHAVAFERSRTRWPEDSLRALTPAGKRKFRKAARGLARCLPNAALVLTSPYIRARDTATLLAKAMHSPKPVACPELAPGESARKAFELLRSRPGKALVLVGHEPNLSTFVSTALASEQARLKIEFKKGGAACLEFPGRVEPGRAILKWVLPPRLLRALK
jgi:phosphohistidine phosphatase